jgi:hypothetical protein
MFFWKKKKGKEIIEEPKTEKIDIVYDVVALSEIIRKWFYGVSMYENIYNPMLREVLKQSYFENSEKIELSKFEEIVKSFLVPKSVESLLSYITKNYVA